MNTTQKRAMQNPIARETSKPPPINVSKKRKRKRKERNHLANSSSQTAKHQKKKKKKQIVNKFAKIAPYVDKKKWIHQLTDSETCTETKK